MLGFLKRRRKNKVSSPKVTRPGEPTDAQKAKDFEVLLAAEHKKKSERKQEAEILKQSPKRADPSSKEFGNIPNPFRSEAQDN